MRSTKVPFVKGFEQDDARFEKHPKKRQAKMLFEPWFAAVLLTIISVGCKGTFSAKQKNPLLLSTHVKPIR
ncbi:hypothetical protein MHI43_26730 [Paenibacillus sp. FSL H8-0457]|uniref:hypothetical protein n=1 Tax=unclassified Paenibacillus TaxID=185978 RepID=UPI001185BB99|nr:MULTISPECIES: hypothetical protein [unclassified Paenibacillus]